MTPEQIDKIERANTLADAITNAIATHCKGLPDKTTVTVVALALGKVHASFIVESMPPDKLTLDHCLGYFRTIPMELLLRDALAARAARNSDDEP